MAGGAAGGSNNQPPFVTAIILTKVGSTTALTPPVFAGQLVELTADAFDPENQPLTYSWSIVAGPDGGVLNNATFAQPTWYSSDVTQTSNTTTPFPEWTIRVEVSDGVNPPVGLEQAVPVRAPRFSNLLNDAVLGSSTLTRGCANSQCHGSSSMTQNGGLVINRFMSSATYTAVMANSNKPMCSISRRVQAFNPSGSLLYRKLIGGVPGNCGGSYNLPPVNVATNEVISIRSWINAGAPQF